MATALVAGFVGNANAFQIDTDNQDLAINWDNTLRYTAGWRMKDPDTRIINNAGSDESDIRFKKHDMVANRIDLLSEFDLVYQQKQGFRVSAAAWYDHAYQDLNVRQNPTLQAAGVPSSYTDNRLSITTSRWYKGPSGEILDAFAFGALDLGEIPVNFKVGQHTVYWGSALFYPGGISYSQAGFDLRKAQANPGSEVKELFLPVNQISFQSKLSPAWSLSGQFFFDWDPYRLPEGGTYLSSSDLVMTGPNRTGLIAPNLPLTDGLGPEHKSGNWGMNLRWRPVFMNGGSMAVTYRKLDEKMPWLFMATDLKSYRPVYPRDTAIYGFNMDAPVGPVSFGLDLSYRKNAGMLTPAFSPVLEGARGNVWHLALNGIYLLHPSPLWDTGTLSVEAYGSYIDKITKNEALYQGVGFAACRNPLNRTVPASGDLMDGCGTKSTWGLAWSFGPQWLQAYPGVDLTAKFSGAYQVKGNDGDLLGKNEGNYNYAIGVEADLIRKYKVNLSYIGYGGKISREAKGAYVSYNGSGALLQDRDWIALTVKTTF